MAWLEDPNSQMIWKAGAPGLDFSGVFAALYIHSFLPYRECLICNAFEGSSFYLYMAVPLDLLCMSL